MNLKTSLKRPARRDATTFVSRYLNEIIDYGGIPTTRADAILDMQQMGLPQPVIDRWLQGNDFARNPDSSSTAPQTSAPPLQSPHAPPP